MNDLLVVLGVCSFVIGIPLLICVVSEVRRGKKRAGSHDQNQVAFLVVKYPEMKQIVSTLMDKGYLTVHECNLMFRWGEEIESRNSEMSSKKKLLNAIGDKE